MTFWKRRSNIPDGVARLKTLTPTLEELTNEELWMVNRQARRKAIEKLREAWESLPEFKSTRWCPKCGGFDYGRKFEWSPGSYYDHMSKACRAAETGHISTSISYTAYIRGYSRMRSKCRDCGAIWFEKTLDGESGLEE